MPSPADNGVRDSFTFIVAPGQQRTRLDVYLTRQVENATRAKVQEAIGAGYVLVNGKKAKSSYLVQPSDTINVVIPGTPRPQAVAENIPLDILFEDETLLVVNKPAGMVTHPAHGHYSGTLVNALLFHTSQLAGASSPLRPGIVHRLDKDTSGLLVVAKTDHAHADLARQFSGRTIEREYVAIVWGRMRSRSGTIEASLGRSKKDRRKVAVSREGKTAVTTYEVEADWRFLTSLRLHLHTGRTHQIRVHLAHIGHPVFGDATYGGRSSAWGGLTGKRGQQAANFLKVMGRQALHARTIGFVHPTSREMLHFSSGMPADMTELMGLLDRDAGT